MLISGKFFLDKIIHILYRETNRLVCLLGRVKEKKYEKILLFSANLRDQKVFNRLGPKKGEKDERPVFFDKVPEKRLLNVSSFFA